MLRGNVVPERPPKSVAESRASVTRLMVPTDANFMGNVFGGVILSEVDRVAYVTATRHSGMNVVTASFDRVDFIAPVRVGQIVTFASRLTYVGRTSMEVWVEVHAEELTGGPRQLVGNAFVTMVGLGADGHPAIVPTLTTSTPEEARLFAEGKARMQARAKSRRESVSEGGEGRR